MTEKEKYLKWKKEAIEKRGLIENHFYINPYLVNSITEEELYKEINFWNEQTDNNKIKPIITLNFDEKVELVSEFVYKELNEINKAKEEGKYKKITFL